MIRRLMTAAAVVAAALTAPLPALAAGQAPTTGLYTTTLQLDATCTLHSNYTAAVIPGPPPPAGSALVVNVSVYYQGEIVAEAGGGGALHPGMRNVSVSQSIPIRPGVVGVELVAKGEVEVWGPQIGGGHAKSYEQTVAWSDPVTVNCPLGQP